MKKDQSNPILEPFRNQPPLLPAPIRQQQMRPEGEIQ